MNRANFTPNRANFTPWHLEQIALWKDQLGHERVTALEEANERSYNKNKKRKPPDPNAKRAQALISAKSFRSDEKYWDKCCIIQRMKNNKVPTEKIARRFGVNVVIIREALAYIKAHPTPIDPPSIVELYALENKPLIAGILVRMSLQEFKRDWLIV